MKMSELRQKSHEELNLLLPEKRAARNALSFLLPQKKVKNVKSSGVIRKDIARILTILRSNR